MIETERLLLRPLIETDLDAYHAQIYGAAPVMRYLPGGQPRPRENVHELIALFDDHQREHGFSIWAACDRHTGDLIGHCGLIYLQNRRDVELAYAFGQAYWGQGYATEGGRAALRYGFEQAHLPRILALAFPANTASQRVMQKLGMTHTGLTSAYHNAELVQYVLDRAQFQPGPHHYRLTR